MKQLPAMTLVKQRGLYDCGVAAMAMVLGVKYKIVRDRLGYEPGEIKCVWLHEAVNIFRERGLPSLYLRPIQQINRDEGNHTIASQITSEDRPALLTAEGVLGLAKGKRALFVVTQPDHYVAWDGAKIFDPGLKKHGKMLEFDDLTGRPARRPLVAALIIIDPSYFEDPAQ